MIAEFPLPNPITPEIIEYFKDQIGKLLGKDQFSQEFIKQLATQTAMASEEAKWIHCVGMAKPLPIKGGIYQETKLRTGGASYGSFWDLLKNRSNAIIFAEAGQGKTTLLRYIYTMLLGELSTRKEFPILYTLRRPSEVKNLQVFVENMVEKKNVAGRALKRNRSERFVLLVDGYDEINDKQRMKVSGALRSFASLDLGNFFLTCRSHYLVIDLQAPYYLLDEFSRDNALRYVRGFSKAYGTDLKADELLNELDNHRLESFYTHPLLLALVCILKSNLPGGNLSPADSRSIPPLPERPIDLIDSAITTMTLRWDEYKGVRRTPQINIYGPDRVKLLEMIAYKMHPELYVQRGHQRGQLDDLITEWLKVRHKQGVDISILLDEIAQWYGIFVPTTRRTSWTFAHRTMQDFLGARYWLSGTNRFDPAKVVKWDHRAAYAASMLDDASDCLMQALRREQDVVAIIDCLHNNAPFVPSKVAPAVVEHFEAYKPFRSDLTIVRLEVETEQDFFHLASYDFLDSLLSVGLIGSGTSRQPSRNVVLGYTLDEYRRRPEHKLTPQDLSKLRILFPSPLDSFEFKVRRRTGWSIFNLSELSGKGHPL